jgi:hypothetical protein
VQLAMDETVVDFDLAGPGATPEGDRYSNAADLHARADELRRLLDMLDNAVSTQSGSCDRYQANVVLARVRIELVRIQLLVASLPDRSAPGLRTVSRSAA